MYRYILFDLDGTLTDSREGIFNSVRYSLEKLGRDVPPYETLLRFVGPPLQDSFERYCGMTAAEAAVKEGGVIIMLAKSGDGTGGDAFYHQMADEPDIEKTLALFMSRSRQETVPDQWQTQIFIRVLQRAQVIYISDAPDDMVRSLHMIPAHSLDEAITKARELVKNESAWIAAIPDGVSVIVTKE